MGSWLPRIADVKTNLGLSEGLLGLVLLALPAGTFIALAVAGLLIKRYTPARTLQFALAVWALAFLLPAASSSAMTLAISLACCGLVVGVLEVASNVEADTIELRIQKRIMSRCHGFWSLGAMSGALLGGGVFASHGISVISQFLIVSPIVVVASMFITSRLQDDVNVYCASNTGKANSAKRAFISREVLLLCLTPMGVMAVEGSFMDWSAVFMREQLKANGGTAGYTFAMFAGVMAVVRLSGDWLAERFGDAFIVCVSGVAAAIGVVVFATASNVLAAFIGAALAGMGVAIVYPLTMTAVARASETHREENVAYLSIAAFSVLMIAPPVIGGVAELSSLRLGLLCLVPGAVATAVLSKKITAR